MHDPDSVHSKEEHHETSASEVENSSDADVESNAEDSSWVSLKQKPSDA